MWNRAFVATTVALGGTLDEALVAIGRGEDDAPGTQRLPSATDDVDGLVAGLRAPTRPARAAALAQALRDVLLAVDEGKLA